LENVDIFVVKILFILSKASMGELYRLKSERMLINNSIAMMVDFISKSKVSFSRVCLAGSLLGQLKEKMIDECRTTLIGRVSQVCDSERYNAHN